MGAIPEFSLIRLFRLVLLLLVVSRLALGCALAQAPSFDELIEDA
jgi:hypothetical protein